MSSSNMILESTTAFSGLERSIGELTMRDAGHRAMISLAFKPGKRDDIDALCQSKLGISLPTVGGVSHTTDGLTLLGLQDDQVWCCQEDSTDHDANDLSARLGKQDGLYLTDHGDGWAILSLEGKSILAVLERLCHLDLDTRSFPVPSVSRTVLEHMGAVIIRTGELAFDIMTPRSYASSLLHAIESVAKHVHHERQL